MKFRSLVAFLLLATTATASYHFVRYSNRFGYQQPIYEKFDLNALVNKTVPFFVITDGLTQLAPGDNINAVMSQLVLAARTWNDVSTSELRVQFGGYSTTNAAAQSGPGIDIVFDDVPPGIISYAGPTVKAASVLDTDQPFTPILRSLIVFRKDLNSYTSFSEAFFLNAVHEFGHALGLQHTFTSSAMSTQITRSTTRSKPLAADDISAISTLYPSPNFRAQFGTVSGRVTQNGNGVNLASVVVLSLNGTSVSTLTNPDGTYTVRGIPAGPYLIYSHPIPPPVTGEVAPGNIVAPRDPDNNAISANNLFDLQFYPGTKDPQAAQTVSIAAGEARTGIDFAVNRRSTVPTLFYPTTFSYYGSQSIRPAFVSPQLTNPLLVATGYGFVTSDSKPVAGLRASILGGSPAISNTRGYTSQYIIFDLTIGGFSTEGNRHLFLDTGSETYVQPSAIQISTSRPPEVLNVNWTSPASDGTRLALLTGNNLSSQSRVFIDGEEALVRNFDSAAGIITIQPPSAPTGHIGRVIVLNPDGQSSLFLRPDTPPQLPYTDGDASTFTISPTTLVPGSESVIEVNAPGARLQSSRVTFGFGSSDVQVRNIAVVSPTRLLASVVVSPNAAASSLTATLITGLNHMQVRNAVQIQGVNANTRFALQPDSRWTNESGSPFVMPGSNAVVQVNGLNGANPKVAASLNDQPINVTAAGNGRVTLQVPASVLPGYSLLRLQVDGETVNSVLVLVSGAAPTVQRVEGLDQIAIDSSRPASPGDTVLVSFTDPTATDFSSLRANDLSLSLGDQTVYTTRVVRTGANTFQTYLSIPRGIADGSYAASLTVNGRPTSQFQLNLRNR